MNFDHKPHRGDKLQPLDEISGYKVRPGFYDRNGAAQAANGVSFTIHSMGATGCTLLLFRPKEQEPFAKIRYPETYCIGSTYSMLVFGLNIEEFEYAFQPSHHRPLRSGACHHGIFHSTLPNGSRMGNCPPDINHRHPMPRRSALLLRESDRMQVPVK